MIRKFLFMLEWLLEPFLSVEDWKRFGRLSFPSKPNRADWSDYKQELTRWSQNLNRRFLVSGAVNFIAALMGGMSAFLLLVPLYSRAQLVENESLRTLSSVAVILAGGLVTLMAVYRFLMSLKLLKSLWFALAVHESLSNLPNDVTRDQYTSEDTRDLQRLLVPRLLEDWLDIAPAIFGRLTLDQRSSS